MKVLTIVGTRPELIKLSLVIQELDRQESHVLVHTGQNYDYELNEIFFKDLGIRKPDHFLNSVGETAVQTIAKVLVETERILKLEKPDAVLLYGDTNSCLAAIAVKKLKIPLFHMEAGNRCFDERVPEEINRRIVDHLSDINMPLTEHGRRYLLAEGLPGARVLKTGSCMFEILKHYKPKILASKVHQDLALEKQKYLVVSAHREENVDQDATLICLLNELNGLAKTFRFPVVFSVHPRTQKRMDALKDKVTLDPLVRPMKPLGFFDYIRLQQDAFCVISDSGTLMEESSILGFPAVHCRESHERPEGMEMGNLIVTSITPESLITAVRAITKPRTSSDRALVPDYQIDNVSQSVVRIIQSYTQIINRDTWRK